MRLRTIYEAISNPEIPDVVYHGTTKEFEKFDINRVGENTGNYGHYGYGIYFSDSKVEAKTYGHIVKKYHIKMSNPFTGTDEQYLQLRELGWNVGDYGNISVKWNSVIKAIKDPELKFFAKCLEEHGDNAWDIFWKKYPNNKNNELNDIRDIYEESDANNHNAGVNTYALDMDLERLGLTSDDIEFNQGFTYKMPLHYVTETGEYGKDLTKDLKKLGYDGVIYGSEFVIFDPDQAELLGSVTESVSRVDQIRSLRSNKPVQVYRGLSKSGTNFYKGSKPLPFTYYALTKEKAESYGDVKAFMFNADSNKVKIFYMKDFFDKFGDESIESKSVIDTLKNEKYDAVLLKGDELMVLNPKLIS